MRKAAEIELLKRQLVAANDLHEANVKKARKLDLAQVDGNLQILGIIQKENAPTLDSEVEKLTGWRAELVGADGEFEKIESELKNELKLSPVSPDSMDSLLGAEPTENVAANVGITDFSSSNADTPGVADLAAERPMIRLFLNSLYRICCFYVFASVLRLCAPFLLRLGLFFNHFSEYNA